MKYDIKDLKIAASPDEIVKVYEEVLKNDDLLGERTAILAYLPFEKVKPYLKEGVTDWTPSTDENLRSEFAHYRDWWAQKVTDGRGLSVHRGKEQFAIRMFLAGCLEWRELWMMDGGYYQEDAYNFVANLFGFPTVKAPPISVDGEGVKPR